MGSVAMDNSGNIAVGYSLSSTSIFPSLAYAGRLAGDPPNGLSQGEATMFTGTGAQIGTSNRWGDYSALQLDPSDDATFWYVNQYYATSPASGFDWHTRIGRFKFDGTTAPPQGTLNGTVTACDTGLPLADALVQVTGGPSSPFSSATAPDGTYSFNLSPGTYQVTIGDPAHNCSSIGPFTVLISNGGTTTQNGCLGGTPKFALISNTVSGGNGDGTIDKNECVTLNVNIQNIGCLIASNVTAQLSTSTPNVTIVQPNTTFPTMNENANGSSQIAFAVETSPSFVCGTPINFTLTINSPSGGGIAIPFSLPTCQVPTITINGALTAGDLQQNARLGRNGISSICGTNKANPGTLGAGNRSYDLYTFVNGPTATCVTIGLTPACPAATNPIIDVAYLNSFNPADITQNYRGDPGGSPNTGSTATFSVDVPAGATLLVNVHEINAATGCSGYTLTVSGLVGNSDAGGGCPSCAITCPANVTVSNDPNQCGAVVNYTAPTVDPICGTVTCSPASGSFFPKGTTPVTCHTTAGSTCSFNVTVNDSQPPTITCPANIVASNDPNQCGAVVNYTAPTASDNCPGVTVSCLPASGSFFPKGATTVTCTATDAASNTATCSFTITVNDTQPPSIACPANITVETAPGSNSANVDYDLPKVSDNCPGVTASYDIPSGSSFPAGTTTVTGTATDSSGNTATCSFTVTVVQKQLTINDVTVTEGDSGSVNAIFTVTLSPTSATQTVTVDFFTSNGTAAQPGDYSSINGTLTFAPGQATRSIVVPVNGDTIPEPSETFFVNLINPTNAVIADAQGQGTILDNDASGNFQFGAGTATANEGAGSATVTITRTGNTSGAASVRYETSDGTALQKSDYIFGAGVVQFGPGETSKTVSILLVDDVYVEGDENFHINLSSPSGNFVLGSPSTITVTITDNDSSPPTTNPIDDPQFFVRQQYLDFLNREPDPGGLAFWTGKITSCGSDMVCINRERVAVSAAFFTSPEFQGTGGTVIRMYKAAFDGQAGQRPKYLEFMRDRGRLIVGPNLAATKQALADEFVTRPEFVAAFPAFFTPAQYVDGLNANTGNSLTQAERDALVNGMIGGTETRSTVLIKIADNALFAQRQNNAAFVLMEYFGYLRRDIDTGGFLFWLSVLNSTGNPDGMVCAFISSGEYQDRFSPIRTHNDSVCAGL
jgi:hypothetical protein